MKMKMMKKVVALWFVLSSLAIAGTWSAQLDTQKQQSEPEENVRVDVIVREGQRIIVFEYEKGDISSTSTLGDRLREAVMTVNEAASVLPSLGQSLSTSTPSDGTHQSTPGVLSKTKDIVQEGVEHAVEKKKEIATHLFEEGFDKAKKARDTIVDKTKNAGENIADAMKKTYEGAEQVKEKEKEIASHLFEEGSDKAKKARDSIVDKTKTAGGNIADAMKKTYERAEQVKEKKIETASHLFEEGSDKAKKARDTIVDKTKTAGENLADSVKKTHKEAVDVVKTSSHQAKENLKEVFQRGHEVVSKALRRIVSPKNRAVLIDMVRLLAFVTAYGMAVWVTFISGDVLLEALPRQQFAVVQSKIYPVYFKAMACSIGLSLLGQCLRQGRRWPETVQEYSLLAALLMVLANMFYFEPHATKVMFERMKTEKEEGRAGEVAANNTAATQSHLEPAGAASTATAMNGGSAADRGGASTLGSRAGVGGVRLVRVGMLNQRLKIVNMVSSLLNVMTLIALTWHLVDLGQRVHCKC